MADFSIKDGASGSIALVDLNRNLHIQAVSEPLPDHACDLGQKFNVNTLDITLTNATKTTVLFMKNTGDDDLTITALIYNLGATASGTGDVLIDVIRNPTAGDIITNANDAGVPGGGVASNQNFGSTEVISGLFYKGASGETAVTDGSVTVSTRSASNTGRIVVSLGAVILPKGSSIAVNYTPPTSNTSQIVQFAAACYVRSSGVISQR